MAFPLDGDDEVMNLAAAGGRRQGGENPEEENLKRVQEERACKLLREYAEDEQMIKREYDENMETYPNMMKIWKRILSENMERLNQGRKAMVSYIVGKNKMERDERRRAATNPTEKTLPSRDLGENHPTCYLLQAPCALHKEVRIKK